MNRRLLILVCILAFSGCEKPDVTVAPNPDSDSMGRTTQSNQANPTASAAAAAAAAATAAATTGEQNTEPTTDEELESANLKVLFIGNSHAAPIPAALNAIFRAKQPDLKTALRRAPGYAFLAGHSKNPKTLGMVEGTKWDAVVLQAQKYSTSGKYIYPTDGAIELARLAQKNGAQVIMYPEWARRNHRDEYERIRAIHDSIAQKTGAKVAPIGEAWNFALANISADELYSKDGNHAAAKGIYLNACVFYAVLTGKSPVRANDTDTAGIPSQTARELENAAWKAVQATPTDSIPSDE